MLKRHFIAEEEVDKCYAEWKLSGKPNSFGQKKVEILDSNLARSHRRDCQNFKLLLSNNFDQTGIDVGKGLPS